MRRCLLFLALLYPIAAISATKRALLPSLVYSAKTIYIANRSGYQSTADGAYDELQKWGRFVVVEDKSKADLVVTFTHTEALNGGTTTAGIYEMTVSAASNDDEVYECSSIGKGFHTPSNRGGVAARDCIGNFRKRVEEPH